MKILKPVTELQLMAECYNGIRTRKEIVILIL